MDAANHVHINFKFLDVSITFLFVFHRCDRRVSTKFSTFNFQFSVLNLCYPEQFYLEYKRRVIMYFRPLTFHLGTQKLKNVKIV